MCTTTAQAQKWAKQVLEARNSIQILAFKSKSNISGLI